MFKPARILQATSIFLLLAGCGTTQTIALSQEQVQKSSPNTTAAAAVPVVPPAASVIAAPSESITAGTSLPGTLAFLQPNGELTPNLQAYAAEVAKRRNVPQQHVDRLLKSAQYDATAARLMAPAGTRVRRSWVTYRNRVVEPARINAGVQFWSEHESTLAATERAYGVPASVIVAIIGVETVYGRNTGNFRVLDALATLGFRYPDSSRPERSQLFRDQLADLIQLDHEKKLNALEVQGSFAGAMGLPQFMPGSLMRYAVDGDNDGRIDLLYSVDDAIVSVANFLRQHGWQPGLPVFAPLMLPSNPQPLVAGGLHPTYDWNQLHAQGAKVRPAAGNRTGAVSAQEPVDNAAVTPQNWMAHKLGVIDLVDEPRKSAEYRTGTPNFFAITQYNRSYFYATSVADLAQAIADQMGRDGPNLVRAQLP
jgi:membrane-bound lytic murein transglycosylase B